MAWLMRLAFGLVRLRWWLLRPVTIGVRLAPIREGQVLLVRHTYQPGWHFPGGAMKRGETPLEAAVREAYEEAGVVVETTPVLMGVYSSFADGKNDHVTVYVCSDFRLTEASDRWEIAEWKMFPLDELPSTTSAGTRRRVKEYQTGNGPYSGRW